MTDDHREELEQEARTERRRVAWSVVEAGLAVVFVLIAIVVIVGVIRGDIEPTSTTGILAGLATGLVGVLLRKGGGDK